MFRIKIRDRGKWITFAKTYDKYEALDIYNSAPTPKMFIAKEGIVHRQYSDNGFLFVPR